MGLHSVGPGRHYKFPFRRWRRRLSVLSILDTTDSKHLVFKQINFTKACKVRTSCCCLSGGACTTLQDQKIRGPTLACQHSLLLTVIVRLYFVSFIPPLKDDMTKCHFYFFLFFLLWACPRIMSRHVIEADLTIHLQIDICKAPRAHAVRRTL